MISTEFCMEVFFNIFLWLHSKFRDNCSYFFRSQIGRQKQIKLYVNTICFTWDDTAIYRKIDSGGSSEPYLDFIVSILFFTSNKCDTIRGRNNNSAKLNYFHTKHFYLWTISNCICLPGFLLGIKDSFRTIIAAVHT